MQKSHLVCPLVVSLVLVLAPPAQAQRPAPGRGADLTESPRLDVSASVGFLSPTDWSDHVLLGVISPLGVFEQVLAHNMHVDPSTALNATVTYWRGRYGFRTHGGFSRSCVATGGRCGQPLSPVEGLGAFQEVDVDTWFYDIGGAIGLLEYTPRRWVWPYVAFGIGGITHRLDQPIRPPLLSFIEGPDPAAAPTIVVVERGTEFVVAVNELGRETSLAFNLNLGTDFRIPVGPAGVGLRLEVGNYMTRSPVRVRFAEGGVLRDTIDLGVVHNLRASAGLVVRIGR